MYKLFANQSVSDWMPIIGGTNRKHGSTMRVLFWSVCVSLLAMAAPSIADDDDDSDSDSDGKGWKSGPLVKLVREATRQYRDVEVAEAMGYVGDTFCISGREEGATGVHYVNFSLIGDGVVNAATPELLVYEPTRRGKLRLVAAEYIVFAPPPVTLEGHLLHRTGAPNRFGIPDPFLELHVWAWKRNPNGTFADFNPDVSCDAQPLTPE